MTSSDQKLSKNVYSFTQEGVAMLSGVLRSARVPVKDPAWLKWHEVKKVDHYYLSVDAVTKPMQIKEEVGEFGKQKE